MELSEISRWWIAYREALRMAKARPEVLTYQFLAAKALMMVECASAEYKNEITTRGLE